MALSSGKSWLVNAFVATITHRATIVPRSVTTACRSAVSDATPRARTRVESSTPGRREARSTPHTYLNGWNVPSPGMNRPRYSFSNPSSCRIFRRDQTSIQSEEHTSELQSQSNLVCRLLLEKKKKKVKRITYEQTITARYT